MSAPDQKALIELAKDALSNLSAHVSFGDRAKMAKELGLSRRTIDRYFSGEVKKINTAESIIESSRKKIARRKKTLANYQL